MKLIATTRNGKTNTIDIKETDTAYPDENVIYFKGVPYKLDSVRADESEQLRAELRTLAKTWRDATGIVGFEHVDYFASCLENVLGRHAASALAATG